MCHHSNDLNLHVRYVMSDLAKPVILEMFVMIAGVLLQILQIPDYLFSGINKNLEFVSQLIANIVFYGCRKRLPFTKGNLLR